VAFTTIIAGPPNPALLDGPAWEPVRVYTYARSNELAALGWDDVDLAHNVIHITKSVDHATHKVKSTKSGTTRRIPIEPALRPVLSRLHQERDGKPGSCGCPITRIARSCCASTSNWPE
jgi:integrase